MRISLSLSSPPRSVPFVFLSHRFAESLYFLGMPVLTFRNAQMMKGSLGPKFYSLIATGKLLTPNHIQLLQAGKKAFGFSTPLSFDCPPAA